MPLVATCPRCSRPLRVADELAGQSVRCPSCDTIFTSVALPEGDAPIPVEPLPEPEQPAHEQEPCPSCGARVATDEPRCPSCGAELDWEDESPRPWERRGRVRRDTVPHRAGLILAMGIVSIVLAPVSFCCSLFGILTEVVGLGLGVTAWTLGRRDLAQMKAREMDPLGYGNTHAGMVCGIIGSVMCALGMLVLLGYIAFIGTMIYTSVPTPMPPTKAAAATAPVAVGQPLVAEDPAVPQVPLPSTRELLPPPSEVP